MYGDYGIFGMSAAATAALISAAGTGAGVVGSGIVSKKGRVAHAEGLAYERQTQYYSDRAKADRQRQLLTVGIPIAVLAIIGMLAARSRK